MASFTPPPGTADIFEPETSEWRFLETTASRVFSRYGYGELRTPIFEYTEVFQRGLGSETEVVKKEMYTFCDRGGRSLTLRPEGTAGVMRALSNTDVLNGVEQRVFYMGPMFRGERPAAGRRRQFHQIGVENVGRCAPLLDAECLAMIKQFMAEIGLPDTRLVINTRGTAADRPGAEEALREYFRQHLDCMCDDCRERFQHNLWRILDCKNEKCIEIVKGMPEYGKFFTPQSISYFDTVRRALDRLGVEYETDPRLVRGLDYYVHTVFELTHHGLGGQTAIAGGGRYELTLPGSTRPVPGVGFAAGAERLLLAREAVGLKCGSLEAPKVFLIGLSDEARLANLELAGKLRASGIKAALELEDRSFKAQLRSANRSGAGTAVIRGDGELEKGVAVLKCMADGSQEEIPAGELAERIRNLN